MRIATSRAICHRCTSQSCVYLTITSYQVRCLHVQAMISHFHTSVSRNASARKAIQSFWLPVYPTKSTTHIFHGFLVGDHACLRTIVPFSTARRRVLPAEKWGMPSSSCHFLHSSEILYHRTERREETCKSETQQQQRRAGTRKIM